MRPRRLGGGVDHRRHGLVALRLDRRRRGLRAFEVALALVVDLLGDVAALDQFDRALEVAFGEIGRRLAGDDLGFGRRDGVL